jgi:hypothetical protein
MLLSLRIALGEPNVAELIEPKCVPFERQFLDGWTDGRHVDYVAESQEPRSSPGPEESGYRCEQCETEEKKWGRTEMKD